MTSALSGRACGIVVLLALSATPASPCSMIGPSPTPAQLVEMATVIVRVRAEGLAAHAAAAEQFGTSQRISFAILAVLKGSLPSTAIEVSGTLEDRDDPNDRPVPYDFVRPDGRAGSCYATAYRQGAEYLLLLQESPKGGPGPAGELIPYWYGLAPTNEQLLMGGRDPWLMWVSQQLGLPVDKVASAGAWPGVRPFSARFEIADAERATVTAEIQDDGGSPLYRLSCRTGDQPPPGTDGSGVVYMGDLDCHLITATAPVGSAENLLRETHASWTPSWMSRGQMYGAQIVPACANYPEYGRIRHFQLRGMRITLTFEDPVFREPIGFPMLNSYTLTVTVEADPGATSDIAAVSGYLPPNIPMPVTESACRTVLKGRTSDIP